MLAFGERALEPCRRTEHDTEANRSMQLFDFSLRHYIITREARKDDRLQVGERGNLDCMRSASW